MKKMIMCLFLLLSYGLFAMEKRKDQSPIIQQLISAGSQVLKTDTIEIKLTEEALADIKKLKEKEINAQDSQGRTALFIAAQYNLVNTTQDLLQEKDIDINKADNNGMTPLALAANGGYIEITQLLLDNNKIDIEKRDKRIGYTPLMRATQAGHVNIVKLLLQYGANPFAKFLKQLNLVSVEDIANKISEDIAALIKNKKKEKACIERFGQDINLETPLHWAARINLIEVVEQLINSNADINLKNQWDDAPLHVASYNNNRDIMVLLIKAGAPVNYKNTYGYIPLHWQAMHGNNRIVRQLINLGSDVNAKNWLGHTPLHWAAQKGHKEIAALLIKNKADINAKDANGITPSIVEAHRDLNLVKEYSTTADIEVAKQLLGPVSPVSKGDTKSWYCIIS